jgi:hypothetical protein
MLMIDDPEIERMIREEAARTGEAPAEVLRRVLAERGARARAVTTRGHVPLSIDRLVVRNGVRLFPVRDGAGIVTHELVKRRLDAAE